ncbi:MAG TPA: alpha/beta hydrolase [Actinophytocola sp.]|nr:alpha/beta hydrolase [Actinophytocola sp.]
MAECALVTVPRDWGAPDSGAELRVAISRVAATGEQQGVILLNPGGPGGQGTPLAGALAALQPSVSERYAFVGMDPRGTGQAGATAPELAPLTCEVPTERFSTWTDLDARDRSRASIAEHRKAPRAVAEACQSEALTPYITTWQTAHDMELVRRLLGESTLNYLGYSYGTWLGAKYASLFPGSTGKMVLDSSTNWEGRLQAAFEAWPAINQRLFDDVFLPWMTRQWPELVGDTPAEARRMWERVRDHYESIGTRPDDYDLVFTGMGSPLRWALGALVFAAGAQQLTGQEPEVGAELNEAALARFGVPATELTTERIAAELAEDYTSYPATRYAVACGDQETRSARWYKRLSDRQGPRFPLYGWAYGLSEVCGYWSEEPRQTLPTLPPAVADNVLVVQGEFDPQTGYEQARAAVRAAPGVGLVSVDDAAFHGQYALDGNPCVDGMVNVFLLHNSRPDRATCPGVPLLDETEVYPVDGPVRHHRPASVTAQSADPALRDLRDAVRNRIGELNAFRSR